MTCTVEQVIAQLLTSDGINREKIVSEVLRSNNVDAAKIITNLICRNPSNQTQQNCCVSSGFPFKVGEYYLFRNVTLYSLGRVAAIHNEKWLTLDPGSYWVAETGRWGAALKTGNLSEIEQDPCGEIVNLDACVVASKWPHPMPVAKAA